MTLTERCAAVSATLARVEAARRNTHQRAAIEQRVREWRACFDPLESARKKLSWVGLDVQEVSGALTGWDYLRTLANEVAGRLAETSDVGVLSEEDLWTRLLQTAKRLTSDFDEEVQRAWRSIVSSHGELETPLDVRYRLPQTPGNTDAMADYETQYSIYTRLANQKVPRNADDFRVLSAAVQSLRDVYAELRFTVPADVEAFFKAVNSSGAGLELFTDTVRAWLQDNGQLSRYVIRSIAR